MTVSPMNHLPERAGVFEPHELAAMKDVFEETCVQIGIDVDTTAARNGLARTLFNSTLTRPTKQYLEAMGMEAMEHWSKIHELYH
jgi:hypothetical protein